MADQCVGEFESFSVIPRTAKVATLFETLPE
jgi:hypothetical protein